MAIVEPAFPPAIETPADLVALRRQFHQWPELRFKEHRTAAAIEDRLQASGYTVRSGIAGTGVLAFREASKPGPHILIRADMDAIPITDLKTVGYASKVPGVAHVCGHDVHIVVAVGVAERLALHDLPSGRVSFMFQPAEERPFGEPSGARAVLDAGVLTGSRPDAILGLHCWPDLPVGSIGIDERIAMGAKDAFRIAFQGKGAHAATPSRGRDAVLGIAQLVTALHQGFSRSLDPGELAILNVGTIAGGQSQSVIADQAEVTGTLRSVDPLVRDRLRTEIERISAAAASMLSLEYDFTWADEMPAIINDPRLVQLAVSAAEEVVGPDNTRILRRPPMTSDDFALFAREMPALYLKLGVCAGEICPPLHSGTFDVDERAIGVGIAVLQRLTTSLLSRPIGTW